MSMFTLDPEFVSVTIDGYRVTNFSDNGSYDSSGNDGYDAKAGVGGTVGGMRVRNPLREFNLHVMQGSPDCQVLDVMIETALSTGVPMFLLILDSRRPGYQCSGFMLPQKRPDDPGIGTTVADVVYSFHLNAKAQTQGSVIPPSLTP